MTRNIWQDEGNDTTTLDSKIKPEKSNDLEAKKNTCQDKCVEVMSLKRLPTELK